MNATAIANAQYKEVVPAGDSDETLARDLSIVKELEIVPTLLDVLCEVTGMRFAAVARVTDQSWTACAVRDQIDFGLQPGGQLDVNTTLCIEVKDAMEPISIDHASLDPRYCDHPTPRLYKIQSYVSVPILMRDGNYFGNLCAIDTEPAEVSNPKIIGMFKRFAALIGTQIDRELARAADQSALRNERAASELREQFIAVLGHDLRNPLQAISASSDLMIRKSDDPEMLTIAKRIKTNSRRMSALIDDVLDFARGRLGGGIGVELAEHDLDTGLNAVVRELQDGQPGREILSNISVTRKVRCDVGRMQQLASNLIGNALTHGSPAHAVQVSAQANDDGFVLEVWNAGDPIPAENLAKIFDPFWRRSTSAQREGLGLGLHICSQIVRAHGGTLTVNSNKNDGTKFTAKIPASAGRA